jgi:hypothetical protein
MHFIGEKIWCNICVTTHKVQNSNPTLDNDRIVTLDNVLVNLNAVIDCVSIDGMLNRRI